MRRRSAVARRRPGCGFFVGSAIAIIPARFHSTRLPGKALALIGGRPMVCHVAERTRRARGLARVIVATDDQRIAQAIAATGAEAVLTRADHPSGTDRLAEVARTLEAALVVNVQGDLPLLDPAMVEGLVARMAAEPALPMATLVSPLRDEAEWRSPHVVKAVVGAGGRALYFSRSPIPFDRDGRRAPGEPFGWRHIGMYAYRRDVLLRLAALPPSPLERREQLEQLRALDSAGATSACTPTGGTCSSAWPRSRPRRSSGGSSWSNSGRSRTALRSGWSNGRRSSP
ncbi:MAG: 3-deoxy-manno-octulosonate cytidylyltransferase [Deltaproteobacteria bacterium]|nr:MAG: 3-deoxy-manno-octulosonate cytidylyltransferase [Deltaproteobacteria bacterium]